MCHLFHVAPLAGAWIEISKDFKSAGHYASLPSRERGLKYILFNAREPVFAVAPLAGAWIEMYKSGATGQCTTSLPSRERGLK